MKFERIIELSQPLHPGREARRLEIKRIPATNITGAPDDYQWYVMHWISMGSHIATHVEVPYHVFKDGADLARVPAEQFIGEAAILDLRGCQGGDRISREDVERAADRAGGIGRGDIVFCMTGWSQYYGDRRYEHPPFLDGEAVQWLAGRGIKMLGIDTNGSMDPAHLDRLNHLPIFEAGVVYVENLTNLEAIPGNRVFVIALPLAVPGLEAVTVRVVALV
jgi:arylformamidase